MNNYLERLVRLLILVASILAIQACSYHDDNSAQVAKSQTESRLQLIQLALDDFRKSNGRFPSTSESLDELLPKANSPGFTRSPDIFVDGWNRRFVYMLNADATYRLYSVGPNGVDEGMKGDDISVVPASVIR